VIAGFLSRNLALLLSFISELSGFGGYNGVVDESLVVGVGLAVSTCSFVVMAVFLCVKMSLDFIRILCINFDC
jgi:hypothetical protein